MPGGRPTVVTEEVLQKLEYAFALGCTDLEACLHANIGKSTLYDYQNANPKFSERKEELKEKPVLMARTTVVMDIQTNPDMAMKYLERKCKKEFSTKVEQEQYGPDGGPVQNSLVVEYLEVVAKDE